MPQSYSVSRNLRLAECPLLGVRARMQHPLTDTHTPSTRKMASPTRVLGGGCTPVLMSLLLLGVCTTAMAGDPSDGW
jgi:hypothetical protein